MFFTCPEKCISYIEKTQELQRFVAEALYQTSRSNFDLSTPGQNVHVRIMYLFTQSKEKYLTYVHALHMFI